eukprot:1161048-Pelagomonas_calceolata.AAC.3
MSLQPPCAHLSPTPPASVLSAHVLPTCKPGCGGPNSCADAAAHSWSKLGLHVHALCRFPRTCLLGSAKVTHKHMLVVMHVTHSLANTCQPCWHQMFPALRGDSGSHLSNKSNHSGHYFLKMPRPSYHDLVPDPLQHPSEPDLRQAQVQG